MLTGVPVTLPARASARLRGGDHLTLAPLVLLGPGGGRLEAHGSAVLERHLDFELGVRSWPLAGTGLPALFPKSGRWAGLIDGQLTASGPFADPGLAGRLAFHDIVAAGYALGDGELVLARDRQQIRFDANLGPHLDASGRLRVGQKVALQATARLAAFPLGPWLARVAPHATGVVSGNVDVALASGKPPEAEAHLTDLRFAWGRSLALANRDVVQVRGTPEGIVLDPCLFEGSGIALSIQGRLYGETLDAAAEGRAALATLVALLPRAPVAIAYPAGDVVFAARVVGPPSAPVVDASATVREPLTLSVKPSGRPAVAITVPGGKVAWHGAPASPPRLLVDGLVLSTPGARVELGGEAVVDVDDPGASSGSWRASASVEAAALASLVPRELERAEGRLSLAAQFDGDPRHGRWHGTVDAPRVVLVPRGSAMRVSLAPVHATIDDQGFVRLAPVDVTLGALGQIAVGTPGQPAVLEIRKLEPFEPGRVALTLHASGLATPQPIEGLRTTSGQLDLRLEGPDASGHYLLTGTAGAARAEYHPPPKQAPSKASPRADSSLSRFLRRLWLDVRLRVPELAIDAPGPDLTLDVDCRLQGPLANLQPSGKLQGRSLYSRMALFFADRVRGSHVRECRN